jgi:phosphoribosylformylglycinamidine synthase subunit PurL
MRGNGLSMAESPALPSVQDALALGLSAQEYELICEKQGRPPNLVELSIYSLLWSEHCAYKHTRRLLRTLPTEGSAVVMGPGENAGAVEVGDGLVCALKVESHNHPSAVEPFQGAATGVGGILRDIFAVGARPIAVLDSLRFGEPGTQQQVRSRYLLDAAVSGVAHYGNSIGVPTVGGELYFESPYEQNCLVNVMALGLARRERLLRSAAAGAGNAVVLLGARTGRDGIGGASVLASSELDEEARHERPRVQVGDPFEEKKLLECSLELLERGLLVSLQDLGAAGLSSAAAEMAAKGAVGIDIDVALVPLREAAMAPFEIMISESQERMLCVIEPAELESVMSVCSKWDVNASAIGAVTDSGQLRVLRDGEIVGEMSASALVDECPRYELRPAKPAQRLYPTPTGTLETRCSPTQGLLALLASPNLASRAPLFEQYDFVVQSRTVRRPGQADAAVLLLDPAKLPPREHAGAALPALAVSIDGNGRRVAADPYWGSVEAVFECASNLHCAGARVLGVTDNLNFGNPSKPHVAWQLAESVRGIADACRALEAPIVSGNVSLYNDGPAGPVYPTPVIGMVGSLPDARRAGRIGFARAGHAVALIGPFFPALEGSELHKLWGEPLPDRLAAIDLPAVRAAQLAVSQGVLAGALASAHDIAEGGLAVALAESCLAGGIGARIELPDELLARVSAPSNPPSGAMPAERSRPPLWTLLFGEGAGGFVVSGSEQRLRTLGENTPLALIGSIGGSSLCIDGASAPSTEPAAVGDPGALRVEATLAELARARDALAELFP